MVKKLGKPRNFWPARFHGNELQAELAGTAVKALRSSQPAFSFNALLGAKARDHHARHELMLQVNELDPESRKSFFPLIFTALEKDSSPAIRGLAARCLGDFAMPQVANILSARLEAEKNFAVQDEILVSMQKIIQQSRNPLVIQKISSFASGLASARKTSELMLENSLRNDNSLAAKGKKLEFGEISGKTMKLKHDIGTLSLLLKRCKSILEGNNA